MTKQLTLKDLKNALQPLYTAVTSTESQISEIHQMVMTLHTKLDLLDQLAVVSDSANNSTNSQLLIQLIIRLIIQLLIHLLIRLIIQLIIKQEKNLLNE